jgi:hypothetical protein
MLLTADTITDEQIRELLAIARNSGDIDTARACYAAVSTGDSLMSSWTKRAARRHCAGALNSFRRGAQECREMLARFVEQGGDAVTAASIRANWKPMWGADPGAPGPNAHEPFRCSPWFGPPAVKELTDEQIRQLRVDADARGDLETVYFCCDALRVIVSGRPRASLDESASARAILNARAKEKK